MSAQSLHGWGSTNPTVADVRDLTSARLASVLSAVGPRGALVRGLGRSYGDAAQNSGGLVLRLADTVHGVVLDPDAGTATVPAGVSLDDLLRLIVPHGFFVPVTPGTRFVTVGGAIASDVHGKNHHLDGTFGSHVRSMRLVMADGRQVTIGPDHDPQLFWATVGGIGLTGAIVEATIGLIPISSSRMRVDTSRHDNIDELMAAMADGDDGYRYSVAWLDPLATGASLGRSVLTRGDHASAEELSGRARRDPLAYAAAQRAVLPALVPSPGLINRASVTAFNELWFRKAPRRRVGELQSIPAFFHPLDAIGRWNRVYGRRGMIQFQFVVPFGAGDVVRTVVQRLAEHGTPSFLSVLKRFGAANPAPLSFPAPGWTLAIDVPAAAPGLAELLYSFDDLILDAGGRHYFAKDAHTVPESIRRGYQRLAEWQQIRQRVDPDGVWQSDMSRRLQLSAKSATDHR
ncbi:MAG TPA: FAD-binding oxidoreductase [Ilumatobacteraceae bacterium]|nr:FAD-binding oxidoreductase [Ilumatobacteraceae bacterium]